MEDMCIERFEIDWNLVDNLIEDIERIHPLELSYEDMNVCLLHDWSSEVEVEDCSSGETNLTIRAVDILLQNDGDVDQRDTFGNTALHNELLEGSSLELIESLLDKQADVNAAGYFLHSPLQLAVLGKIHLDCISTLIRYGANLNHKNLSGQTALHMAVHAGSRIQLVEVLLKHGANVNAKDVRGQTPLHFACRSGAADIVKMLLTYGASVCDQDEDGQTSLHLTFNITSIKRMRIASLLLEHGKKSVTNIQDARGRTPVHLAASRRNGLKLRKMLDSYNGSMAILDNDGNTPVDLAVKNSFAMTVFTERALKLKCANLPVGVNFEFDFRFTSYKQIKYIKELDMMKLHKFGKYSLYDIFSVSHDPTYLNNKEIAEGMQTAVESPDLKKEFKSYKNLLKDTFYKRQQRLLLLNEAQEMFPRTLPVEMRRVVLSYLSDLDLENWIRAQRSPYNIVNTLQSKLYL